MAVTWDGDRFVLAVQREGGPGLGSRTVRTGAATHAQRGNADRSPAPEWAIQVGTFLLRTEPELVLKSRWVSPGRLEREGFLFEFPDWASAAADLVRMMRG